MRVLWPSLAGVGIAQLEEPAGLDAADVDRLRTVVVHHEETAIVGNSDVVEWPTGNDLNGPGLARPSSIR